MLLRGDHMPHDTDGIGKAKRPDLSTLLKHIDERSRTGKGQPPFGQLLAASLRQQKEINSKKIASIQNHPLLIERPPAATEPNSENEFNDILKVVMKHEGNGYVKRDGLRESSKMGILQATAREYGYRGDIRDLTRADAKAIYKKIWDKSGAAKLPYPLNMIHFDTYVNSPAAARKILAKSGGNADAYLEMRAQRYQRLAKLRPEVYAKYLKGWMNRVDHLRQMAVAYAKAEEVGTEQKTVTSAYGKKTFKG